MSRLPRLRRSASAGVALLLLLLAAPTSGWATGTHTGAPQAGPWEWPLEGSRVSTPYAAPAHPYGPGHRGIDLTPLGSAVVFAPNDGVVAFADRVVDRGVLTIDHGGGLVSTLEPVTTTLTAGARVTRGQPVGAVGTGGHVAAGDLHLGARRDGEYVSPLLFLGGVPRAVLLPCCAPLP